MHVGFSDHLLVLISSWPVALGASIIERHFTDSRYRVGPDIICSMDPTELKMIIEKANEIFITTRNAKCRSKEEESVYKFARSSIVADKDLKKVPLFLNLIFGVEGLGMVKYQHINLMKFLGKN